MKKIKILSLVLSIVCFSIAGIRILSNKESINKEFYDECTLEEINIETINKEDKIGANTNFNIITLYTNCNHEVEKNIKIDNTLINKNYNNIEELYKGYIIDEFNNKHVTLKNEINTYCPYHFFLIEENNKIAIYNEIEDDKKRLNTILDIDVSTLRQNDQYMFKNAGIKIYGIENLYQFIEDFDS